jgi:hypothetical protein
MLPKTLSIILWNVTVAVLNPKGITLNLKDPMVSRMLSSEHLPHTSVFASILLPDLALQSIWHLSSLTDTGLRLVMDTV